MYRVENRRKTSLNRERAKSKVGEREGGKNVDRCFQGQSSGRYRLGRIIWVKLGPGKARH